MLMYLINFWKKIFQDISLFLLDTCPFYWTFIHSTGHLSILLDIYPLYRTKWKSVTGQKNFSTGHLNSPLFYMLNVIFLNWIKLHVCWLTGTKIKNNTYMGSSINKVKISGEGGVKWFCDDSTRVFLQKSVIIRSGSSIWQIFKTL